MRERTGHIPSEQETIQQIIYNLVLYLPLSKLDFQEKNPSIRTIVEKARKSYNNGNKHGIDLHDLELLEACLDEKSGISDIGEARMYYASFNKDVNELVARGVDRKQAGSAGHGRICLRWQRKAGIKTKSLLHIPGNTGSGVD